MLRFLTTVMQTFPICFDGRSFAHRCAEPGKMVAQPNRLEIGDVRESGDELDANGPAIKYPDNDIRGTYTQLSPLMARLFPNTAPEQILQSRVYHDGPVVVIVTIRSIFHLPKNWNARKKVSGALHNEIYGFDGPILRPGMRRIRSFEAMMLIGCRELLPCWLSSPLSSCSIQKQ